VLLRYYVTRADITAIMSARISRPLSSHSHTAYQHIWASVTEVLSQQANIATSTLL